MFKKVVIFFIFFVLLFPLANWLVIRDFQADGFPLKKSQTFDSFYRRDYSKRIEQFQPTVILLGDSSTRAYDQEAFSRGLGAPTLSFSFPGTSSAHWHLFLRNAVLGADHQPEMVIIFFRETVLTTPHYLVRGSYFIRLDEIASDQDADVYQIAITSQQTPLERWAERYIPLFAYRSEIYFNLIEQLQNLLPRRYASCDNDCVALALDRVFDEPRINDLMWEEQLFNQSSILMEPENLDFDTRVENSLLPLMLEELTEANITPVFVRLRMRYHTEGVRDEPELAAYLKKLQQYVESRGGLYIDMVELERLTYGYYLDNFHLEEESAKEASDIIADFLREEIQQRVVFPPGEKARR